MGPRLQTDPDGYRLTPKKSYTTIPIATLISGRKETGLASLTKTKSVPTSVQERCYWGRGKFTANRRVAMIAVAANEYRAQIDLR